MRKYVFVLFIFQLIIFSHSALSLDALTGYVNDEANVISAQGASRLNIILDDLKKNTSVEFAVATVNSLNGIPIEEYSLKLAHNFLGDEKKDNGLLILLAVQDREYRIEVGYGLEPIISAPLAGRIGRDVMEPYFKEGNYEEGLLQGVLVISRVLQNDTSWETEGGGIRQEFKPDYKIIIVCVVLILLVLMVMSLASKHLNKGNDDDFLAAVLAAAIFGKGGRGGGSFGGGGFSGGSFGGGGGFGGGGFSGKF